LPNDLTNGLIIALAAGSVKLVIANEFREYERWNRAGATRSSGPAAGNWPNQED